MCGCCHLLVVEAFVNLYFIRDLPSLLKLYFKAASDFSLLLKTQDTYFLFLFLSAWRFYFYFLLPFYFLLCSLPGSAQWLDKRHGYLFPVAFGYTFFRRWFQWCRSCRRTWWSIDGAFYCLRCSKDKFAPLLFVKLWYYN